MEPQVNRIIKRITGEDEYIFTPANKATDTLWTGFLSNRLSFWADTFSSTLTVQSDSFLVIWEIHDSCVRQLQTVEIRSNNTSVSTFHIDGSTDTIRAIVCAGKLSFEFDNAIIERYSSVPMGKKMVNVPRSWFNSDGHFTITEDESASLIHGVLGRPLDKKSKERLTIKLCEPSDKSQFTILLTSRNTLGSEHNMHIRHDEVIDVNAVIQAITDIMGVE